MRKLDFRHVIISEKLRFQTFSFNVKAVFKERLNNVFEKLRFRNGLVWAVRLTVVSSETVSPLF